MGMRKTPEGKIIDDIVHGNLGGEARDEHDHRPLRQGRMANVGFKIGHYLSTPPMFFSRDGHTIPLIDRYRGCPAFFIGCGPSFASVDKSLLKKPGVLTMGYNNVVKTFRPNMWCCVDSPTSFLTSTWKDPTIEKFVPMDHAEKQIADTQSQVLLPDVVGDCPNTWYFRRNEYFDAERFLFEDTINWGNHGDWGGARSGMLAAIRIMFLLGIRTIYLLGVDFKMDREYKYCFDQDRHEGSVKGNNSTYRTLTGRFAELKPIFEKHGLQIFNCNPDSMLKVFPHVPFDKAIRDVTDLLPDPSIETTKGLYESVDKYKPERPPTKEEKLKREKQMADDAHGKVVKPPVTLSLPLNEAKKEKKRVTDALNAAKADLERMEADRGKAAVVSPSLLEAIIIKGHEITSYREQRKQLIDYCNKLEKK